MDTVKLEFERSIRNMLHAWLDYRSAHQARYDSGIGEDCVLGPEWADMGRAIHGLLNGETGRIDCGEVSTIIHETLRAEGLEWK